MVASKPFVYEKSDLGRKLRTLVEDVDYVIQPEDYHIALIDLLFATYFRLQRLEDLLEKKK